MPSDHAFSELLRAIGLVVVAWNQFERGFELLFTAVLPGDGPYSFVIMQALGGYPPRQDMLKVIAKYRLRGTRKGESPAPDLFAEVISLLKDAGVSAQKRNEIVHSRWYLSDTGSVAEVKKARGGKHTMIRKPQSIRNIAKVAAALKVLEERATILSIRISEHLLSDPFMTLVGRGRA